MRKRQPLLRLRHIGIRQAERWGVRPGGAQHLAALESRLAALESVQMGQGDAMADMQREVAGGLEGMSGVAARLASHQEWLVGLERWVSSCVKTLANFGAQPLDGAEPATSGELNVMATLMARLEVATVMDWIANVSEDVLDGPLVSVTIATRNRPTLLREALNSVFAQSYQNFEIVVIDDSDTEETAETAEVLRSITDERLRGVRAPERRGAGAAFNIGLEHAAGEIIVFLDDDNLMHPEWMRSVVWAFTTFPEVQSLYGARSNEDPGAQRGIRSGMLPTLEFAHYDRARHERANYIDRNTIAMRSSGRHVRYDEALRAAFDWDHSLRLFALAEPLPLPVLSCYYRTVLPDRISDIPEQRESVVRVRSRTHTTRPLRVLVHTAMYPVMSETYIGEDIDALEDSGADVTVSALAEAVSVSEGRAMPALDIDDVIARAQPDLVLMHWATHCEGQIPLMEKYDLPFACRVHSFDADPQLVRRIMDHPLCIGVIASPHQAGMLPSGVTPLLPSVGPWTVIPESANRRDRVLSVSAGLPKKDFRFLVQSMAELPEFDRMIIVGRSNGLEDVPATVEQVVAELDPSIRVCINIPRPEVLSLMAESSALLYTLARGARMGSPMSVVEAMLCGTIPVLPDRDESRAMVGDGARTYADRAELTAHVRAIARGGDDIDEERRKLIRNAQRYRDPDVLGGLHKTLQNLLSQWRAQRL
jgi:glycosyltransferase involved in cell wall biosynthesis